MPMRSPVLDVVRLDKVPDEWHVAVVSLRKGGAVEQGTVVVYQPLSSTAVWAAEYTTALDTIKSICGCDVHWWPHGVYRAKAVLSPVLTASNVALLGRVVVRPHSDVAWLEPHRYRCVQVAVKVPSFDASPQEDEVTNVAVASHGIPTWAGAICGTVSETKIIGAAACLLHTPPSSHTIHVVDASIVGAHLRRAQEVLYRGGKGPTSRFINHHTLNWVVEGLRRLPRRLHRWVVWQSS